MADLDSVLAVSRALADYHDFDDLAGRVARNTRWLIGADGATVVIQRNRRCHYVEEDAIGALWKGRDFPIGECVSGWAMQHHRQVVIPDIRKDPRVPLELYMATFVRSLAMTPVERNGVSIGAIGVYWADFHEATFNELLALRAIAEATAPCLLSAQAAAMRE
jgi:GAF domain-containing protein